MRSLVPTSNDNEVISVEYAGANNGYLVSVGIKANNLDKDSLTKISVSRYSNFPFNSDQVDAKKI